MNLELLIKILLPIWFQYISVYFKKTKKKSCVRSSRDIYKNRQISSVFFTLKFLYYHAVKLLKLSLYFSTSFHLICLSLFICVYLLVKISTLFSCDPFFLNFNFLLFHKQFQGYISRALALRKFTEVYVLISINFFFLWCLHRAWKIYNNL